MTKTIRPLAGERFGSMSSQPAGS